MFVLIVIIKFLNLQLSTFLPDLNGTMYNIIYIIILFIFKIVPIARIVGSEEVYMKTGSDINITCVVTDYTKPINILWYHEMLKTCK